MVDLHVHEESIQIPVHMFLRDPSMNPTTQNIPKNRMNSKYKETEKEREPKRGKPKPIKASKFEHEFQRSNFFISQEQEA
jgi:hypothetical protein